MVLWREQPFQRPQYACRVCLQKQQTHQSYIGVYTLLHDLTPTFLIASPAQRVLAAVRRTVTNLWMADADLKELRNSERAELILAAKFFERRKNIIERGSVNISFGLLRSPLREMPLALTSSVLTVCLLLFSLASLRLHGDYADIVAVSIQTLSALIASVYFSSERMAYSPAAERMEIEAFNKKLPMILNMAHADDALSCAAVDNPVDLANKVGPGAPITPPGLTELELSRNNGSLASIRRQLQSTRIVDVGLTIASFVFFLAGSGFCYWQLAETENVAKALISGGVSSLVGVFCYYSTGRARASQLALALFESLVAELELSLSAVSKFEPHKATEEAKNAWKSFRIGVNDLYLLESRKKNTAAKAM